MRTFRVKVMATPAKKARASALLVSGGDTWAWCIDRFHAQIRDGLPNANSVVQMWPGQGGEPATDRLAAVEAIGPVAAQSRGEEPPGGETGRQPGRSPGGGVHGGQPCQPGRDRQPHRDREEGLGEGAEPQDRSLGSYPPTRCPVLPPRRTWHPDRVHRRTRQVFGLPHLWGQGGQKGRRLVCTILTCNKSHHRDVAGAQNMVTKIGRAPSEIARREHRRVGSAARRDRRRHLFDADRGLARTRAAAPSVRGAESLAAPKAA